MEQQLQPHKVTKPIQLLAAWLLGLVLVNTAFLTSARFLVSPTWAAGVLVLASVANVPLFLICIFLLQTRFRPEMQEDSFYSRYLEIQQETGTVRSRTESTSALEMIVRSQARLAEDLQVVHERMSEIQNLQSPEEVAAIVRSSEEALGDVRQRLVSGSVAVELNDLLSVYGRLRKGLENAGFQIANTFGTTSARPEPPVHNVIAFGIGVEGPTIHKICEVASGLGEWYVQTTELPYTVARVFIGAYGYGGEDVTKLTSELLVEMSKLTFTREALESWVRTRRVRFDADYPDR